MKTRDRLAAVWKARRRRKQCCRNCHFLAREDGAHSGQSLTNSWTEEEREKGQLAHEWSAAPKCRQGIWDTGVDPRLKATLEEILDKNRRNKCFFIEFAEGMLFDGAEKLRRMRYENQNLRRSVGIAIWGVYIAAFSALLNFIGLTRILKWLGI